MYKRRYVRVDFPVDSFDPVTIFPCELRSFANSDKGNGAEMCHAIVSVIVTENAPVSCCTISLLFLITVREIFAKVNVIPPSFLKWQIYSLSFSQVINNELALHLIFDSFSFSYGDRAPRSVLARTFAFIWVLIGLVIISIFTATVTTSLTAISLSNEIKLYGSDVSHLQSFNPLNPSIRIQNLRTDLHEVVERI